MRRYHTYTQPHLLLFALASCGMLCLLFSGCVPVDFGSFKESYVTIRPDGSVHSLPPMLYHFYSDQGTVIIHPCDGKGNYKGHLPIGIYNTIATNTNAQNVLFKELNNYERASVHALPAPSAARTEEQLFLYPGDVYSVPVSSIQLNGRDTVTISPRPVLLTHRVIFRISLSDALEQEVSRVSGLLRGIQPSVNLFSCIPSDVEDPASSGTRFVTRSSGETREAEVPLFGITHPEHGGGYQNTLLLFLEKEEGTKEAEIDITDLLSEVIDDNKGNLPLQLSLKIDIHDTAIGLKAEVSSWEYSGSGTGEVEPIDNGQWTIDS